MTNTPTVALRETTPADLETLFIHQLDEDAAHMAAFMNEKYRDREAYLAKWNKLLEDGVNIRTIIVDDKIAGAISTWMLHDELQISYGLGKAYWNNGIATAALRQFLTIALQRPLYGRVAFDNIASARVLEKCGFKKTGEDTAFAFARQKEILEFIYLLEN